MRFILIGLALVVISCSAPLGQAQVPASAGEGPAATAPRAASPVELVFLHINDTHGQTQGTGAEGGYTRLATAVQDVRGSSKAARVFLLDSGDILSRSDALTRRTLGLANIEVMNYLKFDAFVPGNGDFYDGIEPLQAMIRKARFPVLAANVTLADGSPLARPYVIEKVGDDPKVWLPIFTGRARS